MWAITVPRAVLNSEIAELLSNRIFNIVIRTAWTGAGRQISVSSPLVRPVFVGHYALWTGWTGSKGYV